MQLAFWPKVLCKHKAWVEISSVYGGHVTKWNFFVHQVHGVLKSRMFVLVEHFVFLFCFSF